MSEINCNNCAISHFKDTLCDRCDEMKRLGSAEDIEEVLVRVFSETDGDCISRRAAIDALWKALYEYEDKTEKQFIDSEELDVVDWIQHRIFVQNMSDIDRQTILGLPSAQSERKKGKWINEGIYGEGHSECAIRCSNCDWHYIGYLDDYKFCPNCGAQMEI